MTTQESLREAWNEYQSKSRSSAARYGAERLKIFDAKSKSNLDWWLSRINTLLTELDKTIKEIEVEPATGAPAKFNFDPSWYAGYNKALSNVLKIISNLKQR